MRKMITIYILLFLCLFSCGDQTIDPLPLPVEEENVVDLKWATKMDQEKSILNLANGVVYDNWYIRSGSEEDPVRFMAFNTTTGDKEWEVTFEQFDGDEIIRMFLVDYAIIGINRRHVIAFDVRDQTIMWSKRLSGLDPASSAVSNNKYYLEVYENFDPFGGYNAILFEFDVFTGESLELVKYYPDSIGTKSISPPATDNNQIIYFNLAENAEALPQLGIQSLVAYDKQTGRELWRTRVTDVFASNSLHPPVIYDNRIVITGGSNSMYGFDILTGEQLWKTVIDPDSPLASFINTNHLIHDKSFICK
jgi:outer membrane protein assembly factor BamB